MPCKIVINSAMNAYSHATLQIRFHFPQQMQLTGWWRREVLLPVHAHQEVQCSAHIGDALQSQAVLLRGAFQALPWS